MKKNFFALLYVLAFETTLDAQQVIQFRQTTQYTTFAVREPVLRIKPGDTVQATTRLGVGPIYIEGATTNDTLVIKIRKLRPNLDTGASFTAPGFGILVPTANTPMLTASVPELQYIWRIDRDRMKANLDLPKSKSKSLEVDLIPMLGRMAG